MPTIRVHHHGTSCCCISDSDHQRAVRGDVIGWSLRSIRSNVRFLYSIEETGLTGCGAAFTLTVKECPETHGDWHAMRRAFIRRLQRMDLIRLHWVDEWQSRGVPHLHGCAWFPVEGPRLWSAVIRHWLAVAGRYGAAPVSQYVMPITDSLGWFRYLAKHAARGLSHYQRSSENIPAGWEKTGRMWGHVGDWPRREEMTFESSLEAFWCYRRLCRGLRKADARKSRTRPGMGLQAREKLDRVRRRRIVSARRALTCSNRDLSAVRGVSEWMPEEVQVRMIVFLMSRGFNVEQIG